MNLELAVGLIRDQVSTRTLALTLVSPVLWPLNLVLPESGDKSGLAHLLEQKRHLERQRYGYCIPLLYGISWRSTGPASLFYYQCRTVRWTWYYQGGAEGLLFVCAALWRISRTTILTPSALCKRATE